MQASTWAVVLASCVAQPPALPPVTADPLVAALVEALGDFDQEVRQYAGLALAAVGGRAVPHVSAALADSNASRRAAAAYALGRIGPAARDTLPALTKSLKDPDPAVRRQSALAVSRILSGDATPTAPTTIPLPDPVFPETPPPPGGRP